MNELQEFNKYIDELLKFFNGELTEEQISIRPIPEDVDREMQKDSFY